MYLFVYGTLDPRHAPPEIGSIVARFRFVTAASISARLYSLGPYPGVVLTDERTARVRGSVLLVPNTPDVWRELDAYEAVPERLYRRCSATADGDDGRLYDVQVYEYAQSLEHATLIENGIWQP